MSLTQIAVTSTIAFMFIAAFATLWSARGYSFDLRRSRAARRQDPKRDGGRREDDRIVAA